MFIGIFITNIFGPISKLSPDNKFLKPYADAQNLDLNMMTDYEKAVITATQKAKPAVVSVYTQGTQYYRFNNPIYDMLYGLQKKDISSMGSGVIIDPNGVVITNNHVVLDTGNSKDAKLTVVLSDGRSYQAKVKKAFSKQDIAILSIDGKDLPFIEMGASSNLMQGQTVLAIGNPFGTSLTDGLTGGEPTVTRGIISATRRNLTIPGNDGTQYYRNMLQTDAAINEGNSGGALIDLNGKLVGINTAIYSEGAGSIGIGFAIPVDRIKLILDSINKGGKISDVTSGILIQSLNDNLIKSLNFKGPGGVLVSEVIQGSPGDKSGFKKGDIITGINGFNVMNDEQARTLFKGAIPGEVFDIKIYRENKYLDLTLELGSK